ncbi:DEAD-domain-containing protein [Sodiomyces alkalinus F11]|uniref:RNA helicase n=1 Tax=Sodiomyces alkalinus (strain CBS 110278 / VKM F-3762 / F11) TaxID=1314773 RepID=A0A3N2PT09_SODAK|nr:DEAD-domain-containing protein [Sodiomyces alkalinus F11]ROT37554.1 DEAD-domain-containing protein [Sodiomyces alkalinus F11]
MHSKVILASIEHSLPLDNTTTSQRYVGAASLRVTIGSPSRVIPSSFSRIPIFERMIDTFSVADIKSALPKDPGGHEAANSPDATDPAQKGWVKPEGYNYDEFGQENARNFALGFAHNAKSYQFNIEEYGDVGPEVPELEEELFGPPELRGLDAMGQAYETIEKFEVRQRGDTRIVPIGKTFEDAGLHPIMLRNVEMAGFRVVTPIQRFTFAAIQEGFDVVAIAQTGSGKTAAYLLPILNKLMGKAKKLAAPRPNPATFIPGVTPRVLAEPLVVVVCPSRELAVQIFNEARKFCYRTMLRPCVAYGGGPLREQIDQLGKGCDILIASPGRLCDFIGRHDILTLRRLRYLVIDEADEMLHDDWNEELETIMRGGGKSSAAIDQDEGNVRYMLFSATFPKALRDLARTHLAESHVEISVGRIGSTHSNILQKFIEVRPEEKEEQLIKAIESLDPCRTIIFVNSKRSADEVDAFLFNKGYPCASMHADRTQLEREAAMRGLRSGKTPIIIATGVMARGIDVQNIQHVINYDLPSLDYGGIEEYVHRIGRTARMGHRGLATSFCTERDEPMATRLVRLLLENKQEVPEFLQMYMPEGEDLLHLKWEEESNPDDRPADAQDSWGGNGGDGGDGGGGGDTWGGDGGGSWGANGGDDAWGSGAGHATGGDDQKGWDTPHTWGGIEDCMQSMDF